MDNAIVILALIMIAIILGSVNVILFTSSTISVDNTAQTENYLISIADSLSYSVSPLTYRAILDVSPVQYNLSFLLTIDSGKYSGTLIVVPFAANASRGPFYLVPEVKQNATILNSNQVVITQVYLPTGSTLYSGSLTGYLVRVAQPVEISAKIYPGEVIYLWIVMRINGNYYRLGYTYVKPSDEGLGIFVVSKTGKYEGNNSILDVNPPLYFSSNKGWNFGMWFKLYTNNTQRSIQILNLSFLVKNRAGGNNAGNWLNISVYACGSRIFATINQGNPIELYGNAYANTWYFLNLTSGALLGLTHRVELSLYSNNRQIGSGSLSFSASGNGCELITSFGGQNFGVGISQAFLSSLKDNNGITSEQVVNKDVAGNPYYYNNTENIYSIMNEQQSGLYMTIYWYFVSASYPPPSVVNAIVFYSGGSKVIPESGTNTWTIS
ncbi:hypothetical protein HS7_13020 [Sulfolobales archaeon HS-7]|nr:hypothetical protein HS7_13020 [Sulfolobales archaeon HS-7]